MVEKAKWLFDGKKFNISNKVENFKNLEILQSKRDFFNFLQAITFDTFHANKLKFSTYVLYWEYNRKIKILCLRVVCRSLKGYHFCCYFGILLILKSAKNFQVQNLIVYGNKQHSLTRKIGFRVIS